MYSSHIHIFYTVGIYGTRYRLDVMINHRDENTKFLLWDRECTELIGQSADAINRLKIEVHIWIQKQLFSFDMLFFVCVISNTIILFFSIHLFSLHKDGDVDLNASPQALDKLLGYMLAFKIKVQPKFRNSVILKCSTDSSLIDAVMDMLPDAEVLFYTTYFTLTIVKTMYSTHTYLFCMGCVAINVCLIQTSSKINVPAFDSNHSTKHESVSFNHDLHPLI